MVVPNGSWMKRWKFLKENLRHEKDVYLIRKSDTRISDSNYFTTQSLQLDAAKECRKGFNSYSMKANRRDKRNDRYVYNEFNKSQNEHRTICVFCKQNHFSSRCNNVTDDL